MFNNKFWGHKSMRWIVVGCYFVGLALIFLSNNVWLMQTGLVVWIIPIWWCAYMYQRPRND